MGQGLSRAVESSVLCEAAENNEIEVVSQIVSTCPRSVLYKTFLKRRTPLMLAADAGSVDSLLKLLWAAERLLGGSGYQEYIDQTDSRGNTALILAAKHGHAICARLLLEDSASPLIPNSRGDTALHITASRGHAACVDLLLRAWVRSSTGNAVRAADAMVSDGFGEERFVDTHNKAGLAALHLAVLGGSVESAAVLIRSGASPDVPVLRGLQLRVPYLCGGSTPLHIAAFQGDARMCLVLLEGQWRHPGVELRRLRNARGLTPLNCALLSGHHDLARVLVESRMPPPVLALSRRALDYQFPETLRQHLLGILHRAQLLVQLREISKQWKDQGLGRPSDDRVRMVGLAELRPGSIARLTQLVRREGASLRDIITGLEEAFSPSPAAPSAGSASASGGVAAGTSHASTAIGTGSGGGEEISSAAVAGRGGGHGAEARSDSHSSDEQQEEEGGRRRNRTRGRLHRRSRGARRSDRESEGAGLSARTAGSRDVDWTVLEAQRMLSLDAWGMSLSRRRGRRAYRHATSVDGDGVLPQTVLEVQHSAGSVMPPRRSRHRSREDRQQALSNLIQSVHSVEAVVASGVASVADQEGNDGVTPGSTRGEAGPSQQSSLLHTGGTAQEEVVATAAAEHDSSGAGDLDGSSSSSSSDGATSSSRSDREGCAPASDHLASTAAGAPEESECAICFDSSSDVAVVGCGHCMCFVCACKMVARMPDPSCPFCRGPIQEFALLAGARQKQSPAPPAEQGECC